MLLMRYIFLSYCIYCNVCLNPYIIPDFVQYHFYGSAISNIYDILISGGMPPAQLTYYSSRSLHQKRLDKHFCITEWNPWMYSQNLLSRFVILFCTMSDSDFSCWLSDFSSSTTDVNCWLLYISFWPTDFNSWLSRRICAIVT